MIYDKDTVCLPRQGIPFCLRPLYLLELRRFRAKSWDTFGIVDDCDVARNSRCRLHRWSLHRLFVNLFIEDERAFQCMDRLTREGSPELLK